MTTEPTAVEGQAQTVNSSPPVPESIEDTGLSPAFVSDLIIKTLYRLGARNGNQLGDIIRLPFNLLDEELMVLQRRHLIEVRSAAGHGRRGYTFDLTMEGRSRGREAVVASHYVGPAPVPVSQYTEWIDHHNVARLNVDRETVTEGLRHLVLSPGFIDLLGPGISSGTSLFLYGDAGNGKTVIAEAIAQLLGGHMYVPHAVEIEGQIIQMYDPTFHRAVGGARHGGNGSSAWVQPVPEYDHRFVRIERPVVIVGGELTLDQLELQFDPHSGVYRAPPQLKANGGAFIIDDFGRQRVHPRDLLNRWMVPLERHVDFLNLPIGYKVLVPFECLLIFATNLNPADLVEEAFLRRIRYKIHVGNPTREEYDEIFRRVCTERRLQYAPEAVDFIYEEYYGRLGFEPRACHPRDLLSHVKDLARYTNTAAVLSEEKLDLACRAYFLEVPETSSPNGARNWRSDRRDGARSRYRRPSDEPRAGWRRVGTEPGAPGSGWIGGGYD
jgi:hypothetical protein